MIKSIATLFLATSVTLMVTNAMAKPKTITKAAKTISTVTLEVTDSCGRLLSTADWWITWSYNPTAGTVVSPNRSLHSFKATTNEWSHLKVKTLKHGDGKHSYYPGVTNHVLKLSSGNCTNP